MVIVKYTSYGRKKVCLDENCKFEIVYLCYPILVIYTYENLEMSSIYDNIIKYFRDKPLRITSWTFLKNVLERYIPEHEKWKRYKILEETKFGKIYIFEFKDFKSYRKFLKNVLNVEDYIVISNKGNIIKLKNIEQIIPSKDILKVKLEGGKTEYRPKIGVIILMLETLYEKGKVNFKEFGDLLIEKGYLKERLSRDKQSIYINYWESPYRVLQEFGQETGLIKVEKPYEKESTIVIELYNENITLDELIFEFWNWVNSKMEIKTHDIGLYSNNINNEKF